MSRANNLQRSLFGSGSASGADSSFALEHSSHQELARMITSEIHDQMRLFASLEKLFHHPLRLLPLGSPIGCAQDVFTTPHSSLTPADSTLKLLSPLTTLPDPDTIVQMLEMYAYAVIQFYILSQILCPATCTPTTYSYVVTANIMHFAEHVSGIIHWTTVC